MSGALLWAFLLALITCVLYVALRLGPKPAAALATVGSAVLLYLKGRADAAERAKAKERKAEVKDYERASTITEKAAAARAESARVNADPERLRDKADPNCRDCE